MCSSVTNFEKWLRHQIKEQGWTIAKLAKVSGVHRNTIYNYLDHRCEPTYFNVLLIVRALGYDLEAIKK
jgi:DNA-binding phage protein